MAFGDLTQADFAATFNFSRPVAAPFVDASGDDQTAAPNQPRFDHAVDGAPLGLRIERGAALGQGDAAQLKEVALPAELEGQPATILHRLHTDLGEERRAFYTRDALNLVNALLAIDARHAEIGVVPGFIRNRGAAGSAGFVRYRQQSWNLPGLLDDGAGGVLSDDGDRPLIGG